jgi:hypothetical protein
MKILTAAAAIAALVINATALQAAPAKKKDSWCDWSHAKKMERCQKATGGAGRCGRWVNSETNRRCQ